MQGFKSITFWVVIFLVFILLFWHYGEKQRPKELAMSEVLALAEEGKLKEVVAEGGELTGEYEARDGTKIGFMANFEPPLRDFAFEKLYVNGVKVTEKQKSELFQTLFLSFILPIVLILGLWMLIMRQIQSGGNKAMSFGKSRAKLIKEGQVKITFEDVAGVEEAKEELQEVVAFLKDPKRFSKLGGRIPKGVLLLGPPGTGKTLLARAVAGEASVPFFSIAGSDFVEMFVGVGASRVRDLFEQGKRSKPCLIFIDEIDAVGRHRFAGIGGGHDEREQTLNQLLVEMDGFDPNEGVILIAATNRPDVLDPALLRPGRFDRQIVVDFPDLKGREGILRVHSKKIKIADDVDLELTARGTPGFSGADLENIINESALLAARKGRDSVEMEDLEEAKDRVMMGPERRSMVLSERDKNTSAIHEVGHALCAKLLPDMDPVHKVTIIPRGRSLGATSVLPGEDRHTQSKKQLKNYLVYMLGGRAAEEVMEGEFTTGAGDDLHKSTSLSYKMVCEYGMSERLGPRTFGDAHDEIFLGKELSRRRRFSEETAAEIDNEVNLLIDEAHNTALELLRKNKKLLEKVSGTLMERETLGGKELDLLIDGKELPPIFKKEEKPLEEKEEESPVEKPEAAKPVFPDIDTAKPKEASSS